MRTTASAPSGSTAPVEMAIAWPALSAWGAGCPARDSPMSSRRTGEPTPAQARSPARTAKPSMAEQSNGGTGCVAVTSQASTRASAALSSSVSSPSGRARLSTIWRASSSSISVAHMSGPL